VSLALSRSRDVIAARLEIDAAQLDIVAARVYPNPSVQYSVGNLVLGHANPSYGPQGFFDQTVQTIGVGELIDIWAKRSARVRAASSGLEHRKLLTEDALREIVYGVRSAFADVLREQSERQLAHDVADRYAQTVKISQARFKAGDISEEELRRIELEALKYQNDVIEADMELDLARGKLAALLAIAPGELPGPLAEPPELAARPAFDAGQLTAQAMQRRPDLRAAGAARVLAEDEIAQARREAYPDIVLGAAYTHSNFEASGDNPNTLAFNISLPLPLFDRNQANIGRAHLGARRAENDRERLQIAVAHDVAEAVRKTARAATLLAVFEKPAGEGVPGTPTGTADKGGMLERAEISLRVTEKSYRAGAISLIELLDAQRTYLDTRAQYLRALHDFRQAAIDVGHAVGD
jgi:cobalt-zinc-cadmium efflux system outer membrane protein